MAKLILVEDDLSIQESIKAWLSKEKHIVDVAACGLRGLEMILQNHYDLAVLDWQLPGMQGPEILRELEKQGRLLPVIMLTSRTAIDDRVEGIESGAFDYLVKPCSMIELSARIRAITRRHGPVEARAFVVGDIELNLDKKEALKGGQKLDLAAAEYEILRLLAYNQGLAYTCESILSELWSDKPQVSSQLIKSNIKSLQKKLLASGSKLQIASANNGAYLIPESD